MTTATPPSQQSTRGFVSLTPLLGPKNADDVRGLAAANGHPERVLTIREALAVLVTITIFIVLFLASGKH